MTATRRRLYFGHPVNTYGTPLEARLLATIAERFPEWEIENPDQPVHQEGYAEWKRRCGSGMRYYFEKVLPGCAGGIFLPFRDGAWGAGVYGEAAFLADAGKPVWMIAASGRIATVRLTDVMALTVEQTRERIRLADGTPLPY